MGTSLPECPRCRRKMEPGFLLSHSSNTRALTSWIAGAPEWSRWSGWKLKGRAQLTVTTYRCPHCGLLESFAPPA